MQDEQYEIVVGLEVHAQLNTMSKLFCGDSIAYGAAPNTQVSPVTLAHPGTLPRINRKAIELAVRMGLACGCEIERDNYFARKNYFYPDLPKGYQVTQHTAPICRGGVITIKTSAGERAVRLTRIHLEEDAGKSLHDQDEKNTSVDYNRAGTGLIEIVSEPDIRSSEEAFVYLSEIRKLVRYLDICDGNMEEGSLRCDVNISVRKKGQPLGTRVEIKNLNSIRHVKLAIDAEAARLMGLVEAGTAIRQETRSYDAGLNNTCATREKEDADDYRYFPEPDLPPFHLSAAFIEEIGRSIPALPHQRVSDYMSRLELSQYDASVIAEEKAFSDYFEVLIKHTPHYKAAANWMLGPVRSWLNEHKKDIKDFMLPADRLAGLISIVQAGQISFTAASNALLSRLIEDPGVEPFALAHELNLVQQSDETAIGEWVDAVMQKFPEKVAEYRKGKKGLLSLFVGEVMKNSRGKADPRLTNEILLKKLN